ncbi:hypothetical protein [Butyrivibrio sp. MC2021]|uniref:hypothetical protein n=1 Tax=Butyrivibrio sp. MC2021 TaxID=1408306 RepID=UPI00047AAB63|nr:hypothetical protein [Butyrivibrio sp. MC2021]
MNFIVSCKGNIQKTYNVLIWMLIGAIVACIIGVWYILLSFSISIDVILAIILFLVGAGWMAWGVYCLEYSVALTLIVDHNGITIKRLRKPMMVVDVSEITGVTFGRHHDSSRYAPKNRYIMKINVKGESIKVIEDEMENFEQLCLFLEEKNVPTTDEETKNLLSLYSISARKKR